jgi:GNAT superfamily N-acetyltransferase
MLQGDSFIGNLLDKPAWRVTAPEEVGVETFQDGPDSFAYAKVGCTDIAGIKALEAIGFNLVDTNTQFDRLRSGEWPEVNLADGYGVRMAEPSDAEAVEKVAAGSFVWTRFHLDPLVPDEMAGDIKGRWATNFFKGKRGDWMIVPTFEGKAVGFNQLLTKDDALIIDLIAVEPSHQGKGLATAMIKFAADYCGKWQRMLVGTQVSNIPSIRTYEKLGFRMCGSSYVFHYHGPVKA